VDKKKSKAAFDPSEADLKTFTENYVDPVGKQAMGRNELIEIAEKDEKVFSRVLEAGDILSTVVQLVDHGELLEREDAAELPTEEEERRYNMEYEEKMRALDQRMIFVVFFVIKFQAFVCPQRITCQTTSTPGFPRQQVSRV